MKRRLRAVIICVLCFAAATLLAGQKGKRSSPSGPPTTVSLIDAKSTMVTAWDIPMNPLTDASLDSHPLAGQIRWGFRLFVNTANEASRFSPNALACNNCHLNAGQKEKAMPLVGIASIYPEYNKRDGRLFSLEDRIVGCFKRSMGAIGNQTRHMFSSTIDDSVHVPETDSKEVLALSAYLSWLSRGFPLGKNPPWRGKNVIAKENLIPIKQLDPKRGQALFIEKCSSCHGEDGQGVQIGDKKAGPLWGPHSWNDGAGASRIYTLAGMIRYAMPYLDPGSLTDEEAQQISAFINSKERPEYPFKDHDYVVEQLPPDAVYYKR